MKRYNVFENEVFYIRMHYTPFLILSPFSVVFKNKIMKTYEIEGRGINI